MSPAYLYGLHDPGGEHLMEQAGKPGWLLFTEALGTNPHDHSHSDYHPWENRGFGVIVRLNNGYGSAGTIPHPAAYGDFAQRCANFVAASPGCRRWIIGNEPNHEQEWPEGQVIHAGHYVECFQRCRQAIKAVQPDAEVLLAPVAPWNVSAGDWIRYFQEMCNALDGQFDGIALHTYTHGADPGLITSEATMNPPFQDRRFHFRAYQDFLRAVPAQARHLPVYITEADQNDPWAHANTGWVQAAYAEINRWNQMGGTQKIHCLCLYRWPNADRWVIEGNDGVITDFKAALANGYQLAQEMGIAAARAPQEHPARARGRSLNGAPGALRMKPQAQGRKWDPRLTRRGVRVEEFAAQPTQSAWRLVKAEYMGKQKSKGRHHIFVDTLDEKGQRLAGVTVEFAWSDGQLFKLTSANQGELAAVDFPMVVSGYEYSVRVTGSGSDRVLGMGLGTPEAPNAEVLVSYRLVFQRTGSGAARARARGAVAGGNAAALLEQPLVDGNWQRTLAFILEQEGGWSDDPDDPNGAKMKGISIGTYTAWRQALNLPAPTKADLFAITDAEVENIYRQWYWIPSGASALAWPLCLLVMDTAVLHGVQTAKTWLNVVGPNPYQFATKRLQIYTAHNLWSRYGAGWVNRVANVLKVLAALPATPSGGQLVQPEAAWNQSLAFVLQYEGGWSDHPNDPGGPTNKGITLGTYTTWRHQHGQTTPTVEDLRHISDAEVAQIYRQNYWNASGANTFAWPLCLLVMDTAVLHGVGAALHWINEVGPNPYLFAAKRLRVYTNSENWKFFGAGWTNRVAGLLQMMG